ncbi:hypothetical protein [Streptomyces silvensis]|uniref:Uncharacterized protein n=1 Tax=Streptomyces silvensis TaxID=1765722 RepID=A0A0W7X0P8_9ACTN|nr:hypothetical protein [Streptomyces silvensis]KUF16375.1 hypothetical protein AT728_11160 [Streptomyces silvensis]
MSAHHPKHQPAQDEEHPATAAEEVLHEAEDAETSVVDNGERRGKDGEAADALSPNENAQEDAHHRDA